MAPMRLRRADRQNDHGARGECHPDDEEERSDFEHMTCSTLWSDNGNGRGRDSLVRRTQRDSQNVARRLMVWGPDLVPDLGPPHRGRHLVSKSADLIKYDRSAIAIAPERPKLK